MNPTTEYLTQEKYDELKKELEYLKTDKRKEIAESLEYAKSLGDLSENQEYQEARDNQAMLEDRIIHLEYVLQTASIVSTHDTTVVSVGSVITIEKTSGGEQKTYTIVGREEADAPSGKISVSSPLGSAALGKAKGDTFSFTTPGGESTYKITSIK